MYFFFLQENGQERCRITLAVEYCGQEIMKLQILTLEQHSVELHLQDETSFDPKHLLLNGDAN
jgi:hypothetical protein